MLERVLAVGTVMGCVGEGINCGYNDGVCWIGYKLWVQWWGVLERILTVGTVMGVLERVLTVGTVMGCFGECINCVYGDGVCWSGY